MARSVSVPSDAQRVLYVNLADFEDHHDLEDALADFIHTLCKRYPSLQPARYWHGREDLVLAENDHARLGVSEYCGLGAVWVAPKRANRSDCTWVGSMKRDFMLDTVCRHLGTPLRRVATASNGEAFFEAVSD